MLKKTYYRRKKLLKEEEILNGWEKYAIKLADQIDIGNKIIATHNIRVNNSNIHFLPSQNVINTIEEKVRLFGGK